MSRERGEEGIGVYLRIRPAPTTQQSRLLATGGTGTASSSTAAAAAQAAASFQYEVEEDFNKSVLHLHTAQRLVQDAQRPAAAAAAAASSNGGNTAGPSPALVDDVVNNTVVDFQYRFDRVFKPSATQEDVFNSVARGCVQSVLDGMNSTVFAYGQTGSGKTFSITGGTESYQDRGLIPRAMAMIYEEVARRREGGGDANAASDHGPGSAGAGSTTYTITMSYLQIYNDKGQDLLNHGRDARTLEELPPVTIHEMEDDIMLKGLEQHSAPTLSDALNLLFLGDTNRLYCETPMNKTSSRSHCIFTIHLEARSANSTVVRRSKLNLVDLAGSERVSKTGVSGTILTEAKHINLSLHFLEQVIVALSEKAKGVREHVPYRNAFLTMVLRDSLGRNCKTVMLATAHVVASQVAETISTCQFAQRVALIKQAPHVNTETDPALLVRKLRAEVAQLKDEVAHLRANGGGGGGGAALPADRTLTSDEKAVCRGMVDAYVQKATVDGDWDSRLTGLQGDLARMYFCFDVLRERVVRGGGGAGASGGSGGGSSASARSGSALAAQQEQQRQARLLADSEAQVDALRQSLQLKENELQMLLTVLKKSGHASGGGGGAVGGGAQVRFNAAAQSLPPADGAGGEPFHFYDSSGSPDATTAMDATALRRRVYDDARQLVALLRRSASAASTSTAGTTTAAPPAALMEAVAGERSAAAALTRVTALAQQGHLSEAEVAAATEFLESKRDLMRRGGADADRADAEDDEVEKGDAADAERVGDGRSAVDVLLDEQLVQDRAQALEAFKASYEAQHKVEETKQLLRPKYAACKATAQRLNACVDAIKQLKTKIQRRRAERAADGSDEADADETAWLAELGAAKERYNECAAQLRRGKEEIDGMHAYLKHAQEQLVRDFERWFSARQQQVQLAVQQQQRQAQRQQALEKKGELTEQLRTLLNGATAAATTPSTVAAEGRSSSTRASWTADSLEAPQALAVAPAQPQPPPQPQLPHSFAASAPHSLASMSSPRPLPPSPLPSSLSTATSTATAAAPYTLDNNALLAMRGQHRLASLPPSAQSARLGPSAAHPGGGGAEGPPRSADAAFSRLSPPPPTSAASVGAAQRDPVTRPGLVAAVNGWTGGAAGAAPLPLPSDSPPPVSAAPLRTPASPAGHLGPLAPPGPSAGPAVVSPSRPFHLQPIHDDASIAPGVNLGMSSTSTTPHGGGSGYLGGRGAATTAAAAAVSRDSGVASVEKPKLSNPYFPQMPSTGNAAADAQLAELYKAREAMRKQLQ